MGGVSLQSYACNQPQPRPVTFVGGNPAITEVTNSFKAGDLVAFTAAALPNGVGANTIYTVVNPDVVHSTFEISVAGVIINPGTAGNNVLAWADKNRVAQIKYHGISASQISLLYHSSSPLAHDEISAWQGSWPAIRGFFDGAPGGPCVPITVAKNLSLAFENIETKAVIISADPYFQENREALIRTANESFRLVCYPLHNYLNRAGTNKPASGRTIVYGPKLETAITLMGQKAGAIANAPGTNQHFTLAPSTLFVR
jgi:hypothetical protein